MALSRRPDGAAVSGSRAWCVWRLSCVVAIGCGRISFEPLSDAGDEIVPPDQIVVHARDDQGVFAVGAHVIVSPLGERFVTDDTGTARITTTSPQRLDVVFPIASSWRIQTAIDVPPGTAVQVGRQYAAPTNQLDITVPALANATAYWITLRSPCDVGGKFGVPSFSLEYGRACEGETLHVDVFAQDDTTAEYWLEGTLTFRAASSATISGAYVPASTFTITVTNVPLNIVAIVGIAYRRVEHNSLALVSDLGSVAPPANLALVGAPAPDVVEVSLEPSTLSTNYFASSRHFVAVPAGATSLVVDATSILPNYSSIASDSIGRAPQWGNAAAVEAGATSVVYEATYFQPDLHWTAIVPKQAGTVSFAELPTDLAAAIPNEPPVSSTIATYVVPGVSNSFAIDPVLDNRFAGSLPSIVYYNYTLF